MKTLQEDVKSTARPDLGWPLVKAIRRFSVRTVLPEPIAALGDLASNLRWSWHPQTRDLFQRIDPERWQAVRKDPVRLLSALLPQELADLAGNGEFVAAVAEAKADLDQYLTEPRWYQAWAQEVQGGAPAAIGYFSPEFGLTEVLPQYSGGLGILAGDHLKTASDLGVPIVGVGLFYKTGYFKQSLNRDGWQQETYPVLDPDGLPLSLLREEDDTPCVITLALPGGRNLHAHVWRAQVGRVPLLMLDSDIEDNAPPEREVTDRLYGGGTDHRLLQEVLLGIGGVRALRVFCQLTGHAEPDVFHTNEGHAGFLGIERIRELTEDHGLGFDEALAAVRAGTVFTTHTPVPAGIDRFPIELISEYFGGDNASKGVPVDRILALGCEEDPDMFNMAHMGLRLAERANGVSRLHGQVSREMFGSLWPGFDAGDVPITSVTNGVHAPTWVAREVMEIGAQQVGRELVEEAQGWEGIARVTDETVWSTRRALRAGLVEEVRRRLHESWLQRGASDAGLGWIDGVFDPDVLTIGFARRVPSYKRLTLMLRDRDRLTQILLDDDRPVQMVIAGKSHPADDGGKALVQQMVLFADDPRVRHRIVFLPDYDIGMARYLYHGCDVWLNNPLRPLEACGTSGMKSALNGGLNLSIRDGWWDEMYDGANGWAISSAAEGTEPDVRDDQEANALYDLIENQVRSRFYDTDRDKLPRRWIEMVRHTLQSLGPQVLASRMLRDYVVQLYAPAVHSSHALAADGYARARELAAWIGRVRAGWPEVGVSHVESSGIGDAPELGQRLDVLARVVLGPLSPDDVRVQVAFGPVDEHDELREPMYVDLGNRELVRDANVWRYEGSVPLERRGAFGYTVRVLPHHPSLASPLDLIALPVESTAYTAI
jgi:glycogen phosphorylase